MLTLAYPDWHGYPAMTETHNCPPCRQTPWHDVVDCGAKLIRAARRSAFEKD